MRVRSYSTKVVGVWNMAIFVQWRVDRNLRKLDVGSTVDRPELRQVIAHLATLGEPRAIEPSVRVLRGGYTEHDTNALARYGTRGVPELMRLFETTADTFQRRMIADVLVKIGAPALQSLIQVLVRSKNQDVLVIAISAIGKICSRNHGALLAFHEVGSISVEAALGPFVHHQNSTISNQAILAFGFLGSTAHLDRLIQLANLNPTFDNKSTILVAAEALGYVQSQRSTQALMMVQPAECQVSAQPDGPAERFTAKLYEVCADSLKRLRNGHLA